MISRRALITSALFAPAIVKASSLMPIPMLSWREARRTARLIICQVTITPDPLFQKLYDEMQKHIDELITSAGPIPYNDEGWKMIREAAEKISLPASYTVSVT